jgi:hypothetical protein
MSDDRRVVVVIGGVAGIGHVSNEDQVQTVFKQISGECGGVEGFKPHSTRPSRHRLYRAGAFRRCAV